MCRMRYWILRLTEGVRTNRRFTCMNPYDVVHSDENARFISLPRYLTRMGMEGLQDETSP